MDSIAFLGMIVSHSSAMDWAEDKEEAKRHLSIQVWRQSCRNSHCIKITSILPQSPGVLPCLERSL